MDCAERMGKHPRPSIHVSHSLDTCQCVLRFHTEFEALKVVTHTKPVDDEVKGRRDLGVSVCIPMRLD
jgi:hypothetical protein